MSSQVSDLTPRPFSAGLVWPDFGRTGFFDGGIEAVGVAVHVARVEVRLIVRGASGDAVDCCDLTFGGLTLNAAHYCVLQDMMAAARADHLVT